MTTSTQLELTIHNQSERGLCGASDVTLFWPKDELPEGIQGRLRPRARKGALSAYLTIDEQVSLKTHSGASYPDCRACICSCYDGKYVSGTFRHDRLKTIATLSKSTDAFESISGLSHAEQNSEYLIDNHEHSERLFELLWDGQDSSDFHPQGLVIFSGATKSGKSEVAKALALKVILRLRQLRANKKDRCPHLVTFEDPIEPWKLVGSAVANVNNNWNDPVTWLNYGICFTPRKQGTDVPSLSQALRDARRQTPSCFYVGEVRTKNDWEEILDFAGSGHLIIVTTHAGSLVETMMRVMESVGARTPQARKTFANYLCGCVHMEMTTCGQKSLLLPSIWRQTTSAINSLVAEGPSSITPNHEFVLGRRDYLVKKGSTAFQFGQKKRIWKKPWVPVDEIADKALSLDLKEIVGK